MVTNQELIAAIETLMKVSPGREWEITVSPPFMRPEDFTIFRRLVINGEEVRFHVDIDTDGKDSERLVSREEK